MSPLKPGGSLLERAAEFYDFGAEVPPPPADPLPAAGVDPLVRPLADRPAPAPDPVRQAPSRSAVRIDRDALSEAGFLLPDGPVTGIAEEFRLIKRQVLARAGEPNGRTVLVASAQPDDGKTFCAVNLALSLAGEQGVEVVLVDADFTKPEALSILGIEPSEPGLVDALLDERTDVEQLLVRTDIDGLSVLPAGRAANNVPELLAADRTGGLIRRLTADPRRILIFDSPPVLAASPATILAGHVGQVVLVVRADRTTEADLREAAGLLAGGGELRLLLNGAGFAATGRRFGSYYGYGS